MCWAVVRRVTRQPSMPLAPSIVTLGSILCPSQGGRVIQTLKQDKTEAFPIEPAEVPLQASHSVGYAVDLMPGYHAPSWCLHRRVASGT